MQDSSTRTRLENNFVDFIHERTYFTDTYLDPDKNSTDVNNSADIKKEAVATIAAYKRGFIDAILLFIK